MYTSLIHMT